MMVGKEGAISSAAVQPSPPSWRAANFNLRFSRSSSAVSWTRFFLKDGNSLVGTLNTLEIYATTGTSGSAEQEQISHSREPEIGADCLVAFGWRIAGILMGWASFGEGTISMTDTRIALDSGIHWLIKVFKSDLLSFDFKSRGVIFKFRAPTIFSTFARSPLFGIKFCRDWWTRRQSHSASTYLWANTAEYTFHIFSNTNWTNIGFSALPLRPFGPTTRLFFGSR